MINRKKNLVKNMLILFIGNVLPKLASIITLPIITGYLTAKEYGTYDLVLTMALLILPVATLEMQAAAFRFLITVKDDRKQLETYISNIVVFTVPICIGTLSVLYFFLGQYEPELRILFIGYFFLDTYLKTARQIARGLGKNSVYSQSVAVQAISEMAGVFVSLWMLNSGLKGFMVALCLSNFVSGAFVTFKIRLVGFIDLHLVSWTRIKELLRYSWPLVPNSLSSWAMRASNRVIISFFLGVEATAVYAVANKLPNIFSIVQSTFTQAWQENASMSVCDQDSGQYFGDIFNNVLKILTGIMALLIGFTPVIFKILIRGEYDAAYMQMPILYMGVFFSAVSSFFGGIYVAHMHSKSLGITTLVAAVCNVMMNLIFIRQWGLYASSIGTLVSYIFLSVYRMIDVQKIQKIKYSYGSILGKTLILVGMCGLAYIRSQPVIIANMVIAMAVAIITNREMIYKAIQVIFIKRKGVRHN